MSDPTPSPGVTPSGPEGTTLAMQASPVAAKPSPAVKPPVKAKADERRGFLMSWFAFAMTAMTGTFTLWVLGTLRFLFPNVLTEPPNKVKVGLPDEYDQDGKVIEKFKDQNIWVVRNNGVIYALSTTCTHLGCTPNWLESAQKFKCPCHGSGFYISGINFEGPAPRPLERWAISVGDDGQLVVDKSKKFQQERGEWTNQESYIKV